MQTDPRPLLESTQIFMGESQHLGRSAGRFLRRLIMDLDLLADRACGCGKRGTMSTRHGLLAVLKTILDMASRVVDFRAYTQPASTRTPGQCQEPVPSVTVIPCVAGIWLSASFRCRSILPMFWSSNTPTTPPH
jgi:hypothetical protein